MKQQRQAILNLLQANLNEWVPLPEILRLGIAQYNARILELRREGHIIENKLKGENGTRHSWFRLRPQQRQLSLFGEKNGKEIYSHREVERSLVLQP